jgi:hypothetical protein
MKYERLPPISFTPEEEGEISVWEDNIGPKRLLFICDNNGESISIKEIEDAERIVAALRKWIAYKRGVLE